MMRHKAQLIDAQQKYAQHVIDHPQLYGSESSPPLSSSKEETKSNKDEVKFELSDSSGDERVPKKLFSKKPPKYQSPGVQYTPDFKPKRS